MAEHRLSKGYFTCIKVAAVYRFVFLFTVCFVGFNKTISLSFFFLFEQHKAEYCRGSCLLCHGLRRKPSVTTVIEPSAFFSFFFTCLCGDVNGDKNHLLRALCMQHNQNYEKSVFVTLFIALLLKSPRLGLKEKEKKESLHFFCERCVWLFQCSDAERSLLLENSFIRLLVLLVPFSTLLSRFSVCVCAASAIAFYRIRSLSLYLFSLFQRCSRTSLASRG